MTMVTRNFSRALEMLKDGGRVSREGWNGAGMYVALFTPDTGDMMSAPFLYLKTVQGALVPWLPSQTDLLAEDWFLV